MSVIVHLSYQEPRSPIVIEKGQSTDAYRNITEMLVLPDKDVKTAIINVSMITSMFEMNKKIKYLSK